MRPNTRPSKKASKPRKRKAPPRPSNTGPADFPDLPGTRPSSDRPQHGRVPGRNAVRCHQHPVRKYALLTTWRVSTTAATKGSNSRVRPNSPSTRLLASNRMMLHQKALCYSFPAPRQEIPSGLAKRLCVAPAQELWPSPLAFAIGSTATDKNDRYWCHLQCQFRYNLNAFTPD